MWDKQHNLLEWCIGSLAYCIDSPTKSRTYDGPGHDTGPDYRIDCLKKVGLTLH